MKAFGDFSVLGFQSNEHSILKACTEILLDKGQIRDWAISANALAPELVALHLISY
jgi:hypothetical protein